MHGRVHSNQIINVLYIIVIRSFRSALLLRQMSAKQILKFLHLLNFNGSTPRRLRSLDMSTDMAS